MRSSILGTVLVLTLSVTLAAPLAARADEVHLRDGRVLQGETQWTADGLEIRLRMGTLVVPHRDVLKVVEQETPRQELERRRAALDPADLEGAVGLARFCVERDLAAEAPPLLLRVVERAQATEASGAPPAELESARRLGAEAGALLRRLDYHEEDGRWLSPDEYYPARGYVREGGRWVRPTPEGAADEGSSASPTRARPSADAAPEARPALEAGASADPLRTQLRTLEGRVIFVLDRSGSMALAGRYAAALAELEALVATLPEAAELDVIRFDEQAVSLYRDRTVAASERNKRRVSGHLADGPRLDARTDLLGALEAALARTCDLVVVFSDGVPTAGRAATPAALLQAIADLRARSRNQPPIHVRGLIGGAPAQGGEDPAAARALLAALAQRNGGSFRELPAGDALSTPFQPSAAGGPAPEIRVQYYKSRQTITSIRLGAKGFLPAFHLAIDDPALGQGDFAIAEYPVALALRVESYDPQGNLLDSPVEVPLERQGQRVVSTRYVRVVGPLDNQEEHGSHLDKRVYLKGIPGGRLLVIYTRAGQPFAKGLMITSDDPTRSD